MASFRKLVCGWLNPTVDLDAERVGHIVLAIDEALSNCAEHAYPDQQTAAVMTLTISYDRAVAAVQAGIADHGMPHAKYTPLQTGTRLCHAVPDTSSTLR